MNVNEMSCAEVNEAIAKLRPAYGDIVAFDADDRPILEPPDYCDDWAACGPLLEEMREVDVCVEALMAGRLWRVSSCSWRSSFDFVESGDLPEAIARAWLQWKTEER